MGLTVAVLIITGIGITALELVRIWLMNRLRDQAMKHLSDDHKK